jgi:rod shape-determining protein MreD
VRRVAIAWALAAAGLGLTGAAAAWVPRGWLPDPALLAVVVLGLRVGDVAGMLGAWSIGWTEDLLCGGPLGEYALLQLAAWGLTRLVAQRVDLERSLLLAPFVFALCAAETLALAALGSAPPLGAETLAIGLPHALVNAVGVIVARAVFDALIERVGGGSDAARGSLRLDAGTGIR